MDKQNFVNELAEIFCLSFIRHKPDGKDENPELLRYVCLNFQISISWKSYIFDIENILLEVWTIIFFYQYYTILLEKLWNFQQKKS